MSNTTESASIGDTFGCMTLGALFAMALWGAGSVQVYYYFDRYSFDSLYLKVQVAVVWMLETAHQALILGGVYKYLVTHYADAAFLATVEKMLRDSIIITGVIAIVVQSIFVDRIYCLSKRNVILPAVMTVLALGQLACTILYYVKIHSASTFDELDAERTFLRIDSAVVTAANAVIAATLIYLFHTTRTGFKKNDTLANKIVAFTVNTGAVTALCALACLIASLASPDNLVYFLFYLLVVRLYMNSIMSSLNARSVKGSSSTDGSGTPGRNFRMTNVRDNRPEVSSYPIRPNAAPQIVSIKVDTETILDNEPESGRPDSDIDHPYANSKPGTAF